MEQETGALGIIVERDVPVPMRDGITLRANVFRPDSSGRFPALVQRTPYGKAQGGFEDFVRAGYVVVTQDTRGRYASEGEFRVFSEENTGDAEDGYDTVEWAAVQPWCDGKVGTFGASYNAWMQYQLARLRPPHLVAMSAVSIPTELTDLDWPRAFKPARRVKWWVTTIAPDLRRRKGLPPPHTPAEAAKIWDELEQGRMLALLPWINVARYLPAPLADQVAGWLRHPDRRPWRFEEAHRDIEVPNLDFTGWFDHCCSIGQFIGMRGNARTEKARNQTKVIIGPWNHVSPGRRTQGDFDFGPDAEVNVQQMQIRWFDYWLKGIDNGVPREPPVRYFVMGSGRWKSAETWPPPNLGRMTLYLAGEGDADLPDGFGALGHEPPKNGPPDTYTHDPFDPVPTLWDTAYFYNVSDRRRLDHRKDVLRYCTAPLKEDVEVVGNPEVVLYAASSAVDTDFFARLVDDDPGGTAMEICYGMVRARHRNGLGKEDLLTPGEVTRFAIRMGITSCCFRKGHRIRLEICGSDFPNHDRNHNTGRNDLLDAEMVIAEQQVHHSPEHPSALILPVSQ
ncbi:MAG TPA: CocE/NonD family hydrolase [Candidatus Latescibacteria bacterium]|nr:CocE/NonD family hydrolase [Candidatus Latescibacterota bacterium]HOS66035.1 CocE/NonD family hydrolase [Candidatus Latescibacterota bacterium]HPK76000.1 CocE/NonD family hydrolase [Candidatus Latescibacterota bacterium]